MKNSIEKRTPHKILTKIMKNSHHVQKIPSHLAKLPIIKKTCQRQMMKKSELFQVRNQINNINFNYFCWLFLENRWNKIIYIWWNQAHFTEFPLYPVRHWAVKHPIVGSVLFKLKRIFNRKFLFAIQFNKTEPKHFECGSIAP